MKIDATDKTIEYLKEKCIYLTFKGDEMSLKKILYELTPAAVEEKWNDKGKLISLKVLEQNIRENLQCGVRRGFNPNNIHPKQPERPSAPLTVKFMEKFHRLRNSLKNSGDLPYEMMDEDAKLIKTPHRIPKIKPRAPSR